jgi:hypothetical protein
MADHDVTPDLLDPLQGLTGPARQRAVAASLTHDPAGRPLGLAEFPPAAITTYQVVAPRPTHTRTAGCAEVGCEAQRDGFKVICPPTDQGRAWARRIRTTCRPAGARLSPVVAARIHGRYTLDVDPSGAETYTFGAGTPCFTAHRVTIDRPELYVVRGGDLRGNPRRQLRRLDRADQWVDEFQTNQDQIATRIERG